MIRAVIVDDEGPARRRMRQVLEPEEDVRVVAECADGERAVEAILDQEPDLVFLDIRMPEMTGFDVLRRVGPARVPAVVFVTGFQEHALEAFEARALDYLVKPFTRERFAETMTRVRRLLGDAAEREALLQAVRELVEEERAAGPRDRLEVSREGRVLLLRQGEVVRIEGAGNRVRIHTERDHHLKRTTLKGILEELDSDRFARVHNSHIVNVDRIRELRSADHGDYRVILDDGSEIPVSRSYSPELRKRLGL